MQLGIAVSLRNRLLSYGLEKEQLGEIKEDFKDHHLQQTEYIVNLKRPAARDGHTGCLVELNSGKAFMLVFGGDRH